MMHITLRLAACLATAVSLTSLSMAQELPKTHLNIVGHNSPQLQSLDERRFWHETVPAASNGAVTAKVTPIDQAGIDDKAMLRMLKMGVMDGGGFDLSKMAGDDPRFEGCDLAGLAQTPDQARATCAAYREVIDRQMQKDWNTKLLALGANQPQVLWCRDMVTSAADLKGKKVRVFNHAMRDLLQGVGATGVNMAFAEVVPALNSGVIDCAVTGSIVGNMSGWAEVSKSVFMYPLGWSINAEAINLDVWNRLPSEVQAFLTEQSARYEDEMWKTVHKATDEANNCNNDRDPCTIGKRVKLVVTEMSDEDKKQYQALVNDTVVPNWKKRCGAACTEEWEATVGAHLSSAQR